MVFWLLVIFVLVLVLIALLALVVGGLLGMFAGGIIGGVRGNIRAPEGGRELATYRGVVWGGCLGLVAGMTVAVTVLYWLWTR
jgi:hypothetical protein